jgi:hypothetical protein
MKTKDGEIIELQWDCGAEFFYIRGHIRFEVAKKILLRYFDGDDYEVEEPVHKYARWSCDARVEYDHSLMDYDEPGRGRFKITEFKRIW